MKKTKKEGVTFGKVAVKTMIIFGILFAINFASMGLLGYLLMFPMFPFCNGANSFCNACYADGCWAYILVAGTIAIFTWSIIFAYLYELYKSKRKKALKKIKKEENKGMNWITRGGIICIILEAINYLSWGIVGALILFPILTLFPALNEYEWYVLIFYGYIAIIPFSFLISWLIEKLKNIIWNKKKKR